jgi:transcriptional regulator with XRE-family HTH domain
MPWGSRFRPPTVTPVADDEQTYKKRMGAVITELRLARGYGRQTEFATAMHVDLSTIGRWERGVTLPNAFYIRELARVLDVDYATLIDPPDRLTDDILAVSRVAGATVRREVVKRAARRRRSGGKPS